MKSLQTLSIIVPLYRCSSSIEELYRRLDAAVSPLGIEPEFVFVNDASPENDWEIVCKLASRDKRVHGINLSRNFGQHTAITAGIDEASGDWLVVMDGDLQDQPEEIPHLFAKALEGYDIVQARRALRQDGFFKRLGSRLFATVFTLLSGRTIDNAIGNFSLISAPVAAEFRRIRERNRSYPQFLQWLGFKTACVDVHHAARTHGTSSYTIRKLIRFALANIFAFSNRPLVFSIGIGFFFSGFSFAYGLYVIISHFLGNTVPPGWTTIVASIFFVGGIILAVIGITGIYLGQVFDEVKGRPLYVISRRTRQPSRPPNKPSSSRR